MARKFPKARIVAVSNSAPQRLFIEARAKSEGLANITVLTRNVAQLETLGNEFPRFDRVVSVEMFEHMSNYETLLERISRWLVPGGKLFVHIFTHKDYSYPFETTGDDNWMGRYFFTGGQMPSHKLLSHFQKDLRLEQEWVWDGTHYSKTSEAWLANMDKHKKEIINIMADVYGASEALKWFHRWRVFFIACAELFGYDHGREWGVSHYRFVNRRTS
jgi:cyclopropane-fatty-acyl-phospholipid synthase